MIQPVAFAWLVVAAGFLVVALAAATRRRGLAEVAVPVLAAAGLAFPYLFILRYGDLRFLLPASAVLAVPVAYGVLHALRVQLRPLRPVAAALVVVMVLGQLPLHRSVGDALVNDKLPVFVNHEQAAVRLLHEVGVSPPCLVMGDFVHGVGYELGCHAVWFDADHDHYREPAEATRARAEGKAVAAIFRPPLQDGSYLLQWRRVPTGVEDWLIFLPPDHDEAQPDHG